MDSLIGFDQHVRVLLDRQPPDVQHDHLPGCSQRAAPNLIAPRRSKPVGLNAPSPDNSSRQTESQEIGPARGTWSLSEDRGLVKAAQVPARHPFGPGSPVAGGIARKVGMEGRNQRSGPP